MVSFITRKQFLLIKYQCFISTEIVDDDDESADQDEDDNHDDRFDRDATPPPSPGPILNDDDFHGDHMMVSPGGNPLRDRELDESKQFFELVQQFMAEYTASAKVLT